VDGETTRNGRCLWSTFELHGIPIASAIARDLRLHKRPIAIITMTIV
jgi:hypothetical protein